MRTVHLAVTDFMCQAQKASEEFHHPRDFVRATWSSFPSGCEEHVSVQGPVAGNHVRINARVQTSGELMRVFLATDAVRRMGAKEVSLFIPYLPYARQDRVCGPGESMSASVMAKLINSQNYTDVLSIDPHSGVMPALIDNFTEVRCVGHVMAAKAAYPEAVFCAPDAGAIKRTEYMSAAVDNQNGVISCFKRRTEDGLSMEILSSNVSLVDTDIIIVDDICDGGRTFIELAKRFKEAGANKVVLCVTHGLFTKGVVPLLEAGIAGIYTTNSYVIKDTYVYRTEI